ncbi:MAG: molybdopterin molybdotransferase MoeA [Reichenbachiella sp.]|uniref:molybdopterin molybdotransferase MoeA n=1 Tax=Reichenbachiella sp. TaxID=2184521 RepID=UPI0032676151
MISVEEAKNIINLQTAEWGQSKLALADSIGEVLAEDISADRDFPPFDRVTMDGIALNFDAFASGNRRFKIQDIQLAGAPPLALQGTDSAIEIMTGAVLSQGCDLVIRYEDLEFTEHNGQKWVTIGLESADRWKNVHRQASDQPAGTLLISAGVTITAAEVAIMATVGKSQVLVNKKPKIAIVSTGDELVDVASIPMSHQIRKSNSIAIQSTLNQLNVPCTLYHLLDDKPALLVAVADLLDSYDILLLSGGVSKGKADYLPEVLEELGVKKLFHKVAQRPGKPFWFGSKPSGSQVFAFPGNPISTYMCFRVYFLPWLLDNLGYVNPQREAVLMEDFSFKLDLGYFLQVRVEYNNNGSMQAYPETGNGSGDLANLAQSDGFLYLPAGQVDFKSGRSYEFYSFALSNFA